MRFLLKANIPVDAGNASHRTSRQKVQLILWTPANTSLERTRHKPRAAQFWRVCRACCHARG
jgi:hypothetical protein